MFDDSWIESFRAVMTRAVRVLGARGVSLWLNQGKLYDIPEFSGKSLTEVLGAVGGIGAVMSLLDSLEAGDAVPILLMDRHVTGKCSKLQLVEGQLLEVWPDGKRLPVDVSATREHLEHIK